LNPEAKARPIFAIKEIFNNIAPASLLSAPTLLVYPVVYKVLPIIY
jgi:hypothetical protein